MDFLGVSLVPFVGVAAAVFLAVWTLAQNVYLPFQGAFRGNQPLCSIMAQPDTDSDVLFKIRVMKDAEEKESLRRQIQEHGERMKLTKEYVTRVNEACNSLLEGFSVSFERVFPLGSNVHKFEGEIERKADGLRQKLVITSHEINPTADTIVAEIHAAIPELFPTIEKPSSVEDTSSSSHTASDAPTKQQQESESGEEAQTLTEAELGDWYEQQIEKGLQAEGDERAAIVDAIKTKMRQHGFVDDKSHTEGPSLRDQPTRRGKLIKLILGLDKWPRHREDFDSMCEKLANFDSPQHEEKTARDYGRTYKHLVKEDMEYHNTASKLFEAYVNFMVHFVVRVENISEEAVNEVCEQREVGARWIRALSRHFAEEYPLIWQKGSTLKPEKGEFARIFVFKTVAEPQGERSALVFYIVPALKATGCSMACAPAAAKAMMNNPDGLQQALAEQGLPTDVRLTATPGFETFGVRYTPGIECYTQSMPLVLYLVLSLLPKMEAFLAWIKLATEVYPRFDLSGGFPDGEVESQPGITQGSQALCLILQKRLPEYTSLWSYPLFFKTLLLNHLADKSSTFEDLLKLLDILLCYGPHMRILMLAVKLQQCARILNPAVSGQILSGYLNKTLEGKGVTTWADVLKQCGAEAKKVPEPVFDDGQVVKEAVLMFDWLESELPGLQHKLLSLPQEKVDLDLSAISN